VAGRDDDEMKAREGLFLLTDALEIARRRLQAEQKARGSHISPNKRSGAPECGFYRDVRRSFLLIDGAVRSAGLRHFGFPVLTQAHCELRVARIPAPVASSRHT
jgi:hypothetical protein